MKAITLWQPIASAVAWRQLELLPFSWIPPKALLLAGDELAIHAGGYRDDDQAAIYNRFIEAASTREACLAPAEGREHTLGAMASPPPAYADLPFGAIVAVARFEGGLRTSKALRQFAAEARTPPPAGAFELLGLDQDGPTVSHQGNGAGPPRRRPDWLWQVEVLYTINPPTRWRGSPGVWDWQPPSSEGGSFE